MSFAFKNKLEIPKEVSRVPETLKRANFKAFLVGGCVRDLLIGQKPHDWDVTTDAHPEEIQKLFEHTFYENSYGTVGVVNDGVEDKSLELIEVTPFRIESEYSDKRRPDSVSFSKNIEDDLKRRDFTINALALDNTTNEIVDLFNGQIDLKEGIIRTVGKPEERFAEDALRVMRAVRLSAQLGFSIEKDTFEAIKEYVPHLKHVAKERIRDEFIRLLSSNNPMNGLVLAKEVGMLPYIAPELEEGIGVEQNQAHAYDVWEHLIRTVQHAADKNYELEIRLAALFHDIGKPRTRSFHVKPINTRFTAMKLLVRK